VAKAIRAIIKYGPDCKDHDSLQPI